MEWTSLLGSFPPRWRRVSVSALSVLSVYGAYLLLIVPLVEPTISLAPRPTDRSPSVVAPRRPFARWFPPGSWELDEPMIIETDQGTVLFDEYAILESGNWELKRCSVIYALPAGDAGAERPVILRASGGAELEFESRADTADSDLPEMKAAADPLQYLTRKQRPRLSGGRLRGRVTIDCPPSGPHTEDAVHVETGLIQIRPTRIWAPGEIRFRYGANSGSGRDLSIHFHQPGTVSAAADGSYRPQAGGWRPKSFELVHLDRLELRLVWGQLDPAPVAGSGSAAVSAGENVTATVEARCAGPLLLDFESAVASLVEQVAVIHHSPDGPSDQLLCELLEIHLGEPAESGPTAKTPLAAGMGSLATRLKKLVATGYPAILRAPSQGLQAYAERIEYSMDDRRLRLEDRRRVKLAGRDFEIQAPQLECTPGVEGDLDHLWIAGPGRLTGTYGADGRQVDAVWRGEVKLRATGDPNVRALTLTGVEQLAVQELGRLRCDLLRLLIRKLPPWARDEGGKRPPLELDQLEASGSVQLDAPRISARLAELQLWFSRRGPAPSIAAASPNTAGASWPLSPPAVAQTAGAARSRFELDAAQLRAQVLLGAEPSTQPQLDRLEVRGGLQLREQLATGGAGVSILAETFDLVGGASPQPLVRLRGSPPPSGAGPPSGEAMPVSPARVTLAGLELAGHDIEVRPGENLLRVAGPGSMATSRTGPAGDGQPAARDARYDGLPPGPGRRPQSAQVSWQGGMQLHGRLGTFRERVVVSGHQRTRRSEDVHFQAQTQQLDVTLNRAVDFSQTRDQPEVEIRELFLGGWVLIESTTRTADGMLKSLDQMETRDLRIDQETGAIHGEGPGRLTHRGLPLATSAFPRAATGNSQRLQFLQVDFARQMRGNLHVREVGFEDQVRCLFGLIPNWHSGLEYVGPAGLGEQDVLLTCRLLEVVDMGSTSADGALELRATGNAQIVGQRFSGGGHRVSYAQAKDLLILEGNGHQPGVLRHQRRGAATPEQLTFDKVQYRPRAGLWKLLGLHAGEFSGANFRVP